MRTTSYSEFRENLAAEIDKVHADREPVLITRDRGKPPAVLISLEDFASWEETCHLLRSPRNAERLLESVAELEGGGGRERLLAPHRRPFVVKTSARSMAADEIEVSERPMFGGGDISPGDEVFVWFEKGRGSGGLAWRGEAVTVEKQQGRVRLIVGKREGPHRTLNNEDIRPFRDAEDESGRTGIARKLYKHAHNKIARLSDAEREYLTGYFLTE